METLKFPLEQLTNRGLTVIFGNRYLPNLPGTTNCPYQLPNLNLSHHNVPLDQT